MKNADFLFNRRLGMEEQVALRNSLHNEKQENKTRKDRELFAFSVLFISDKIYAICLLAQTRYILAYASIAI